LTTPDKTLLSRPPRLKADGSGYDWREFDRYLQKIYSMLRLVLGADKSYNIPNEIKDSQLQATLLTYDTLTNDISPHTEEILRQMLFDMELSRSEDRLSINDLLIADGSNPTWENRIKELEAHFATTAAFTDKTNIINTSDKYLAKAVWNTNTVKYVYATGSGATDVWNDAVGALAHTPI
jgi:hypothetical protein